MGEGVAEVGPDSASFVMKILSHLCYLQPELSPLVLLEWHAIRKKLLSIFLVSEINGRALLCFYILKKVSKSVRAITNPA